MKRKVLKLIINTTCIPAVKLREYYESLGRAEGDTASAIEYLKDCLSSTVREKTDLGREKKMKTIIEATGDYPTAKVVGGCAYVLSIVNDKTAKINLPAPVSAEIDGKEAFYVTMVVNDGILSGVYGVTGAEYVKRVGANTEVDNPAQAFKDIYQLHDDLRYETMFIIPSEVYAGYHMQPRLEIETLAQMGRNLTIQNVDVNGTEAKLFTVCF